MTSTLTYVFACCFAAACIGLLCVIVHLLFKDAQQMRHPSYMSFVFMERKLHVKLGIAFGLASWFFLATTFVLIRMGNAT